MNKTKRKSIRFEPDLLNQLEQKAKGDGRTFSNLVHHTLQQALDADKANKKLRKRIIIN